MQAAAGQAATASPYGLVPALQQGGIIALSVFAILVIMSIGTFYILCTKLMQQQKIISQGRKVRSSFWNSSNLREAATKLDAKSAYRAIVDDALVAQDQHGKLTDPIDQHDWMANSLARSQGAISARLGEGLACEALIMTALGLVVAVPAVLVYNWLIRRNKSIMEDLAAYTNDLHGYLMSAGAVKPSMGGSGSGGSAPVRSSA